MDLTAAVATCVFVECQSLIENDAERLQCCSDWQRHTSHFDGIDRGR